jgi:hypothetical protein
MMAKIGRPTWILQILSERVIAINVLLHVGSIIGAMPVII